MKAMGTYYDISKIILFALSALLLLYAHSYIFVIRSCIFSIDPILSPEYNSKIQTKAKDLFINKPFLTVPLQSLQEEFPCIKSVNATYNYGAKTHCFIEGHKPLIQINGAIMTESGKLYEKSVFQESALDNLPALSLAHQKEPHKIPTRCQQMIYKIPNDFFELFDITWIDHTKVLLKDKNCSSSFIIAQHTTVITPRLLHHYEQLKSLLVKRTLAKNKCWTFDVRFKNQIIVAQKERGLL